MKAPGLRQTPTIEKTVDKALAFITIKPDKTTGAVLYFETKENAKKYLEK